MWGIGGRLFGVLAVSGPVRSKIHAAPPHTQEKRAGTLHGMEQNRLFRGEQSNREEDACGADWYSLQLISVDTSFLPLTAEQEANLKRKNL